MSFQPQAPTISPPPPPFVPTPPPFSHPAKGKRRKGMMVLGLVVILVGLLGGGAIVGKAMSNYEEAVKALARAPVGCTTTLVFDKPATFIMYIETKGKLGDLGGDCEANGGEYEHTGDKLPKVSLTLEDPNGDPVDLQRGVTASYDVGGFVGTAYRSVQIAEAGTYHLNVESPDSDFAISIGKDPKKDSEQLTLVGGAVAIVGFVVGLLLFLLGLRRRHPSPATADVRNPVGPLPGWPPGAYPGAAPTAPPVAPLTPTFAPQPPLIVVPGQPPVRPPDPPSGGGFAPPTLAPPSPPSESGLMVPANPVLPPGPPTLPPTAAPPPDVPPPAAPPTEVPAPIDPLLAPPGPSGGWSFPRDDDKESGSN